MSKTETAASILSRAHGMTKVLALQGLFESARHRRQTCRRRARIMMPALACTTLIQSGGSLHRGKIRRSLFAID